MTVQTTNERLSTVKMARMTAPLTDTAIRKAKPSDKAYKLSDGNNLYLVVRPNGTKFFRFDYTFEKKRKSMSFGIYPEVSLKEARIKRDEAKQLIIKGLDPINKKREPSNTSNFLYISEKWLDKMSETWSPNNYKKVKSRLQRHVLPFLGNKNINSIEHSDILKIIASMQDKKLFEIAYRCLNELDRIYKFAVTYNYTPHNIIADIDKRSLLIKKEVEHMPAITDTKKIKNLMSDLKEYEIMFKSDISTAYALQLAPYVFLRPYNLRLLTWNEVNLENKTISIEAKKMKMKQEFTLPLSNQAISVIHKIGRYSKDKSEHVFPSSTSNLKPLSENTLNHALARLGYKSEMTTHGFRSMFSTIAHEKISEHGFHSDIIEACLAHAEQNKVKAAYNRTNKMKYFEEKKALVQWWADWLDSL